MLAVFGTIASALLTGAAPSAPAPAVLLAEDSVPAKHIIVELDAAFVEGNHSLPFRLEVPHTGRYRSEIHYTAAATAQFWIEDHVENPDGRTYDITGPMNAPEASQPLVVSRAGSPLASGAHSMRLHIGGGGCSVHSVRFVLLREHHSTPRTLTQSTRGDEWRLVWSDEFDGAGLPDARYWTHDLGDWGWGNRELQYYTEGRTENARQEGGLLVIEARPDDLGKRWTSARLTTRGKLSFLYGRIVIRARVPSMDGAWAAGWTLGDQYRDELSWPYCGEIDICEAVGREIEDETGSGVNHASCHTRAFYFKQGNHISSTIAVEDMGGEFHDYACEWDETGVRMFLDGEHYYTYDRTSNELEWPFGKPQNLILNLAMGGGMGGPISEPAKAARFEIDHVRVYERH